VRKMISGLVHGAKPALVLAVLVAVVGATGTAWAGKGNSGNDGGKGKQGSAEVADHTVKNTSFGDKGDTGDKSDHAAYVKAWFKKHPKHHKPKPGNGGGNGNDNGNDDDTDSYGVASVWVSRGGAAAVPWATYSTLLGSPIGDNTGGVFRFTCSTANAPCTVAVKAAVLSDDADPGSVYPRVLIYKQDYNAGGPSVYCEYGDGSTGSAPLAVVPQAPTSTPVWTAVPVNVGFSDDCGIAGPGGDKTQITVPAGYYDVHSTFTFQP
jgi:hypothetical protein